MDSGTSGQQPDWLSAESILASTADGYWQADLREGRLFVSQRFRELLGIGEQAQEPGRPMLDYEWVHPEDRARTKEDFERMLRQGREELSHEYRLKTGSGGWLWVQGRIKVLEWDEERRPKRICGWVSDISRRRQLEQAIGALLEKQKTGSIDEFLADAVTHLTRVLGFRFGHVGILTSDRLEVQTLAAVRDGKLVPNFRYRLEGSPCANTVTESLCAYPQGVQSLFPQDRGLRDLKVESYLGIALRSRRNEVVGLLAAMDDKPLHRSEIPEALISLLADRIAREFELTRTESALDRQMRHAHQMFETSINGIGLLSEVQGADGRLADLLWLEANPALEQHLGAHCSVLIGRSIRESGECGDAVLEMAQSMGALKLAEKQVQHPTGQWFDVRVYRPDPGLIGVVTSDVTHQRIAEETIRESESRMRSLLANLSHAALVLDLNGRVMFANRAAGALVGGTEEDLVGELWLKRFLPIDERMRVEGVLAAVGGLANCPPHVSNRILRLDGTERMVEWDIHQIRNADGSVDAITAVGRDITEAQALQRRARLAQRMEAVGKLAGGVAHDFNNLLTVINGYVRLSQGLAENGTLKTYLGEIERAGSKANELTRQLLALSRGQPMQARDFPAHQTIQSMESLLARLLGADVFLDVQLAASNDWIHFDPNAVEQVLLTLSARAREVAPKGGAVRLSTACVIGPLEVQGGVLPEHGYFRLRFEDDGSGMSDQSLAQLFEPFSETDAGLRPGLELATIYSVLSQGGGGVNVESGDWGTRFDLYIPSAPPRTTTGLEPHGGSVRSVIGSVLLVEDQDQVRLYASDVLRGAGLDVIACSNAADALAALSENTVPIAVLVTDLVMPGMSGRELAMQARQMRQQLPVVFMSGYAEMGPTASELEVLGARFLQKPFTPDQLEAAVRNEMGQIQPARIVIADDDHGVRAFLRNVLEGAGYQVAEAEDGFAAMQILRSSPAEILVTDLVMPGQEGIETIRDARRAWPDLKIIAISGAFYGQFLRTAEMLGARAVLQKPIRPEDLLKCVREVLEADD